MNFNFYSPVKIIFGEKVTTALPPSLAEAAPVDVQKRVLIVSDEGLAQLNMLDEIVEVLVKAGWEAAVFTGVQSNPTPVM